MSETVKVNDLRKCSACGGELGANAPHGLCPKCLLEGAVAPTETANAITQGHTPSVEEVQRVFPQLEIKELLGAGGMGAVFKARQPKLDRFVALKLMAEPLGRHPAFAERFQREARSLARLNHPNIVAVYDFGEAGGYYYLLMEYVDGVNLRQAMRAGRLSPKEALQIVPPICEALQFAHDNGVLHRDVKPENILIDAKGRVKIADFGVAKLIGQGQSDVTLTQSGAALGTPAYMAPEQIENPAGVDHRADIYSLGVVFYEMLTGELPLGRFAAPSKKTPLDVRVDEIVLRALEKERELRQQSAGEVKTQVEDLAGRGEASRASFRPGETSHVPNDFVLCNPRLPRMAQAITVYSLVLAPFLWVLSLALLDFDNLAKHPAAAFLEAAWQGLGEGVGGFITTLALVVGGAKLRGLRPGGPRWLRSTIWIRIGLGVLSLVVIGWAEVLDWESEPTEGRLAIGEAFIGALGFLACGFEIASLIWLRRNRDVLKALTAGEASYGPVAQRRSRLVPATVAVLCLALVGFLLSKLLRPEQPPLLSERYDPRTVTWAPTLGGPNSATTHPLPSAVALVRPGPVRIGLSIRSGQGVLVEFISNTREGIKGIPGSSCFYLASAERDGSAIVEWSPATNRPAFFTGDIPWQISVRGEGGALLASLNDLDVPNDIAQALPSGGFMHTTGWLDANDDSTHWFVERAGTSIAGVGVRMHTFAHGLGLVELGGRGFAGTGTNWSAEFPPATRTPPPNYRYTEVTAHKGANSSAASASFQVPAGLKARFEIWAHAVPSATNVTAEEFEVEAPGTQAGSVQLDWSSPESGKGWTVVLRDQESGRELKRFTGSIPVPAQWEALPLENARVKESDGYPATLLRGVVDGVEVVWKVELYYGAVPIDVRN